MSVDEALEVLTTYANTGMRVATAAEVMHWNRKTMYKKIRLAGSAYGIDPFDFYELASVLVKGGNS